MIICYIAHPIGGKVEENLKDLRRIIRIINLKYPNVVPFCPYYADCVSLNDGFAEERERGIKNDVTILRSGIVNYIWLTGNRISEGMKAEINLAASLGIPIINHINKF